MYRTFTLATLLSVFLTQNVSAQETAAPKAVSPISKGHYSIGTNLGVGHLSAASYGGRTHLDFALALNPGAGYFVSDRWLLSGEIISSALGSTSSGSALSRSAGIGLAARYYFGKPSDAIGNVNRLRFYAEAGGSYELRWLSGSDNTARFEHSLNAVVTKAGVGFNYLLNEHVAFETGLGGRHYMYDGRDLSHSSTTLQMDFGIRVFLSRKKAR